jgi:hypothetical protein
MSSKLSLSPTSIHFILLCNPAAALDVLYYRTILSALRDMSSLRGTGLYTSFPSPTLLLCIMYMLDNRCAIVRAQLRCYIHIDDGLRVGELQTIRAFNFYLNFLFLVPFVCVLLVIHAEASLLTIIRNYAETILLLLLFPKLKRMADDIFRSTFICFSQQKKNQ